MNKIIDKIHFNFKHLVAVTSVATMAFVTTFSVMNYNKSSVKAETIKVEHNNYYNNVPIDVNYGSDDEIVEVSKDILKNKISVLAQPKKVVLDDGNEGFLLDQYLVKVEKKNNKELKLVIKSQNNVGSEGVDKVQVNSDEKSVDAINGTEHIYLVKVNYVDTIAPKLELKKDSIKIEDNEKIDLDDNVKSVSDNKDQKLNVKVKKDLPKDKDGKYKLGKHEVEYEVEDENGNKTEKTLSVKVVENAKDKKAREEKEAKAKKEKREKEAKEEVKNTNNDSNLENNSNDNSNDNSNSTGGFKSSKSSSSSKSDDSIKDVKASSKGAAIAAAAKAQLGVHQDCTMLVTNSLKAVGINFHGWPAEYLSLGTVTSNPQPGDICVYGNKHVAIYIGGGKAVHGGWSGGTTAIFSVNCSVGSPVYVRVK